MTMGWDAGAELTWSHSRTGDQGPTSISSNGSTQSCDAADPAIPWMELVRCPCLNPQVARHENVFIAAYKSELSCRCQQDVAAASITSSGAAAPSGTSAASFVISYICRSFKSLSFNVSLSLFIPGWYPQHGSLTVTIWIWIFLSLRLCSSCLSALDGHAGNQSHYHLSCSFQSLL